MKPNTDNSEMYRAIIPTKKEKSRMRKVHEDPNQLYVVIAYAGTWQQNSIAMSKSQAQKVLGRWKSENRFPGAKYRLEKA